MNGRDLIIYIMENKLEDQEVFQNGKLLGFMTPTEAAVKYSVGVETVKVWCEFDVLKHIKLGDQFYIPANQPKPDIFDGMEPTVDDLLNAFQRLTGIYNVK